MYAYEADHIIRRGKVLDCYKVGLFCSKRYEYKLPSWMLATSDICSIHQRVARGYACRIIVV